jgi:hypothetical protein
MKMKIAAMGWALILISLWVGPICMAQETETVTVQAIGASPVRAQNMQTAREDAVAAALANAMGRALLEIVPSDAIGGRFQVLTETALSRTDLYIRNYKVLAESTYAHLYRVLIEATVNSGQLKAALKQAGVITERSAVQRLLVLVAERRIGDAGDRYWWGGRPPTEPPLVPSILAQQAGASGYRVVDPAGADFFPGYPPELNDGDAVAFGARLGADLVVVGRGTVEEIVNGGPPGQQRQLGARLDLRALRVEGGGRIAQSGDTYSVFAADGDLGSREALAKAAGRAGEELFRQINAARGAGGPGRIEVVAVSARSNMAELIKFRTVLSNLPGVDKIQLKEMMKERAVIGLDYTGNAKTLADTLAAQNFDTFGVSVSEILGRNIRVQLVPR